jgi:hypothetical protein
LLRKQLAEGKDMDDMAVTITDEEGSRIYYKPATIHRKLTYGSGLSAEVGWITNYWKGAFYNNIAVEIYDTKFTFRSDVYYYERIILRSGEKIMHLNKRYMKTLVDEIINPQLKLRKSV